METSWSVLSKPLRPRSCKIASKVRVLYDYLDRTLWEKDSSDNYMETIDLTFLTSLEFWHLMLWFLQKHLKNGKNLNGVQRSCFLYRFYCFLWTSIRRGALRLQGNEKELTTKQSYSEKTMNASESERKRVNFTIIEWINLQVCVLKFFAVRHRESAPPHPL